MSSLGDPSFDALFEEDWSAKKSGMIRCKCGSLLTVDMPKVCHGCGEVKALWRTLDGTTTPLEKMDLGHLNNTVRMLAEKAEQYPSGAKRAAIEEAIDIFYAEIGSRDKEIVQVTGIMAALTRSLGNNVE